MVDPESIAKAIHDLNAAQTGATPPATSDTARTAISDAQIGALFEQQRTRDRDELPDLLAIGVGAIGAIVGGLLLSQR